MNTPEQIRAVANGPSLCSALLGDGILVSRDFLRNIADRLETSETKPATIGRDLVGGIELVGEIVMGRPVSLSNNAQARP